ncbi:hypothetical protein DTL42_04320 [Bremerella cremea]|uniref:Uncharacterized protein n=1 Tax=Bremerella cremea TaxID=1031537 RepID=A0A368KVE0_9BACT|nr:hypothetical protein [Bremerella cremea]RCS54378.1 hypothetical protein DTL42_04320 [Bremerella cremea]
MSQSTLDRLNRAKRQYDRGMLSTHEYPIELVRCAATLEFAEFLKNVPSELIPKLQQLAAHAPARPEDVNHFAMGAFTSEELLEERNAKQREEYFAGCQRLRQGFFPDRDPKP